MKVKGQKERASEEYYVFGWKVLVLIDVHTRLPLARKVGQIQEREECLRTELVGIEGLTTYDSYADPEHTQQEQRRNYEGHPINAAVVRRWEKWTPTTGGTVYVTNGSVKDPFVIFDT